MCSVLVSLFGLIFGVLSLQCRGISGFGCCLYYLAEFGDECCGETEWKISGNDYVVYFAACCYDPLPLICLGKVGHLHR
jgi:hypothetical protein